MDNKDSKDSLENNEEETEGLVEQMSSHALAKPNLYKALCGKTGAEVFDLPVKAKPKKTKMISSAWLTQILDANFNISIEEAQKLNGLGLPIDNPEVIFHAEVKQSMLGNMVVLSIEYGDNIYTDKIPEFLLNYILYLLNEITELKFKTFEEYEEYYYDTVAEESARSAERSVQADEEQRPPSLEDLLGRG